MDIVNFDDDDRLNEFPISMAGSFFGNMHPKLVNEGHLCLENDLQFLYSMPWEANA